MSATMNEVDAWAELGVPVGSSLDVARRAWRAAAWRTHPDRGGDAVTFDRKLAAWEAVRKLASGGPHLSLVPEPAPEPWSRARAINRAVELGLEVEDMGDTTGVVGEGGEVVWFSDEDVEAEDCVFTWEELDDYLA